ncbi:helix-turn-helix domain-containing protein [Marichromatium bheemlicum]|uniref:Helix-turn-helix domain-containing protein n=1 Tax=Marichromatium bheemlicum TaxID=365339 RepID=A0ABX1I8E0_9GAMM|nr:helix-turn-helix domain-containing protein [Marichromatium bheemlicum]NKN32475.1 helix-turn-helix domain-containing protein [Marichromatium bheemlicum]
MTVSPLRLSTAELSPADARIAWRAWMASLFFGVESEFDERRVFCGELDTYRAGALSLTRLCAEGHRVIQPHDAQGAGGEGALKVLAPWRGHAVVSQSRRQAWVRAGGWALYDTTAPYRVSSPEWAEHLILLLPRERFLTRGLPLETVVGRHLGGSRGISRVALETMRHTFQALPEMSTQSAQGAGELILELVELTLRELLQEEAAGCSRQALFRDRVRDHIARHLRDPGLSVTRIAQALHCSRRHLHNAFADDDETPGRYIQRLRLEGCMRDLVNPALAHRTLTEVAFSWGFTNSAHFSRVFRRHVGVAPREFREAASAHERRWPRVPDLVGQRDSAGPGSVCVLSDSVSG